MWRSAEMRPWRTGRRTGEPPGFWQSAGLEERVPSASGPGWELAGWIKGPKGSKGRKG